MVKAEARTRIQRVWVDEWDILHATPDPGVEITAEDAREAVDAGWVLQGGAVRPVIMDMRAIKSMTREARAFYAGPYVSSRTTGAALLVGNALTRAIANFFLGLNRAGHPLRLCGTEEEAVEWCKSLP